MCLVDLNSPTSDDEVYANQQDGNDRSDGDRRTELSSDDGNSFLYDDFHDGSDCY